jgi:hypothetical protein
LSSAMRTVLDSTEVLAIHESAILAIVQPVAGF